MNKGGVEAALIALALNMLVMWVAIIGVALNGR